MFPFFKIRIVFDLNLVWIVVPNLYFITTILTYAYYLRHDFLRENTIIKIEF